MSDDVGANERRLFEVVENQPFGKAQTNNCSATPDVIADTTPPCADLADLPLDKCMGRIICVNNRF